MGSDVLHLLFVLYVVGCLGAICCNIFHYSMKYSSFKNMQAFEKTLLFIFSTLLIGFLSWFGASIVLVSMWSYIQKDNKNGK